MTELNLGGSTASPAAFGGGSYMGGRHRKSHKLRLVKKKTVRRMLAKHGLKMRGGNVEGYSSTVNGSAGNSAPVGGRRRRTGATRRRRRGMFHF
jgi:hypothetical protein